MFIETRININNIESIVAAAKNMQDAGKLNEAKQILHDLGKDLIEIKQKVNHAKRTINK